MKQSEIGRRDIAESDEQVRIIDRACQIFEQAWFKDSEARIESLIPEIRNQVLRDCPAELRAATQAAVFSELIHVEMDLRAEKGERFRRREYELRFPDYEAAVNQAWLRLADRYPDSPQFHSSDFLKTTRSAFNGNDRAVRPSSFGPFQDIIWLGEGGFGSVFRAYDSRSGDWVALKFPHQELTTDQKNLDRFMGEANRLIGIQHPRIVETKSIETHDGHTAIVMQLVQGGTLKEAMSRPRTKKEIGGLIAKIADGLAFAHRQGLIHRDLKPSNILLDENGEPFIADFGLSLHRNEQDYLPDEQCGTPPYMSPQLVQGLTQFLDGRTDIWSLGVMLYELLTGKRPFHGISREEVFDQIETRDPKPIREFNSTVDYELQRICLKCLSRSARDRYLTADDLSSDLNSWLESSSTSNGGSEGDFSIVPRGLRTYEKEDVGFYLGLLPGPRDRDRIPTSVKFWLKRFDGSWSDSIEPVPVGVIYGPSGSGKSSLVKAAVAPLLPATTRVIYVECTRLDTEVRLIKAIRAAFPDTPPELALPELFWRLGAGRRGHDGSRVLIVLDQFEQRLTLDDNYEQSQLAKALRHCDGVRLQCLLVARESFWLYLTRFADTLEMDLQEGRNCQAIDLFGKQHARKVMCKLGQAYGRLPRRTEELSSQQNQFLDLAIEQLSQGHFIVCIQLIVFVEMLKFRDWNPEELKAIGGVRGAGESFLEYHFGEASTDPRFQHYKPQVRQILQLLLPEEASNIRGAMTSLSVLQEATGASLHQRDLEQLLGLLDEELRLISKTHPYEEYLSLEKDGSGSFEVHYQLTHDYLVPSIRNWLELTSLQTAQGRTRLRFGKLAKSWESKHDRRFLPTLMEYLSVVRFLKYGDLTDVEKSLYRRSSIYYLWRLAFYGAMCAALIFSSYSFYSTQLELSRSRVQAFLAEKPASVERNIERMQEYRSECASVLRLIQNATPESETTKLVRIAAGLVLLGEENAGDFEYLITSINSQNDSEAFGIVAACHSDAARAMVVLEKTYAAKMQEYRQVQQQVKSDATDSEELGEREFVLRQDIARLAIVMLTLGRPDVFEHEMSAEESRFLRLELVHSFPLWATPESCSRQIYRQVKNPVVQGSVILGLGKVFTVPTEEVLADEAGKSSASEFLTDDVSKVLNEILGDLKQLHNDSDDEFVRSAVQWLHRMHGRRIMSKDASRFIRLKVDDQELDILDREVTTREYFEFLTDWEVKVDKPRDMKIDGVEPELPKFNLSQIDAILYCNWLSEKEGKRPCYRKSHFKLPTPEMAEKKRYLEEVVDNDLDAWDLDPEGNGYRLMTTKEWEVAAEHDFFRLLNQRDVSRYLSDMAWSNTPKLSPGKLKMPNETGIFDLYGNVAELCFDGTTNLNVNAGDDVPLDNFNEVSIKFRGGGVEERLLSLINSSSGRPPYIRDTDTGFRIVRNPVRESAE